MTKRYVVLALIALFLAALALRLTVFQTTYDVASIAAVPVYKDQALLDRAWALPVASTYGHGVASQSDPSTCGPTSLANVYRSFGLRGATAESVVDGTGRCRTGYCIMGLTLDELADVAMKTKAGGTQPRKVTVHRNLDRGGFHTLLQRANDTTRRLIVNFNRGLLFGKGQGHHSPIGAYLAAEDLVLVLDVNADFGPWLVSADRLFAATDSIDDATGMKRGILEIE